MTTGYTNIIYDGRSVKEYVQECVKAFFHDFLGKESILNTLNERLNNSIKSLEKETAEYNQFNQLTDEQLLQQFQDHHKEQQKEIDIINKHKTELRDRYEKAHLTITKWDVPSSLIALKQFALDQLSQSIDYDCKLVFLENTSFKTWKSDRINHYLWIISLRKKDIYELRQGLEETKAFFDALEHNIDYFNNK